MYTLSVIILLLTLLCMLLLALPVLDRLLFNRRAQRDRIAKSPQKPTASSNKTNVPKDDESSPNSKPRPSNEPSIEPAASQCRPPPDLTHPTTAADDAADDPMVGPYGEVADLSGELFETPGFLEAYRRRHNIRVPLQPAIPIPTQFPGPPSPAPVAVRRRRASLSQHPNHIPVSTRQHRHSAFTESLGEPTAADPGAILTQGRPAQRREHRNMGRANGSTTTNDYDDDEADERDYVSITGYHSRLTPSPSQSTPPPPPPQTRPPPLLQPQLNGDGGPLRTPELYPSMPGVLHLNDPAASASAGEDEEEAARRRRWQRLHDSIAAPEAFRQRQLALAAADTPAARRAAAARGRWPLDE